MSKTNPAEKMQAAESIRRLAVQYAGMMAAADALDQIGSIEQATQEAKAAQEAANLERDVALAELQKVKDEIAQSKEQAASILEEARSSASEIVMAASSSADEIKAKAESEAQELISSGREQASRELQAASDKVAEMQAKLQSLTDEANEAIVRRDQAVAAATDSETRLARIQSQIGKLAAATIQAEEAKV